MRDDLLDAQAAVDWAVAQIPSLQERFIAWQRVRPYELVVEPDLNPGYELLVARQVRPVDPLISAETGVTINSARSALDLLAAALATRNGVKPSHETHFPIFRSEQDMIDPSEHTPRCETSQQCEIVNNPPVARFVRSDRSLARLLAHEEVSDGVQYFSYGPTSSTAAPDANRSDNRTLGLGELPPG